MARRAWTEERIQHALRVIAASDGSAVRVAHVLGMSAGGFFSARIKIPAVGQAWRAWLEEHGRYRGRATIGRHISDQALADAFDASRTVRQAARRAGYSDAGLRTLLRDEESYVLSRAARARLEARRDLQVEHAPRLRRLRRNAWTKRYGAEARKARAGVLASIVREFGSITEYGRQNPVKGSEYPSLPTLYVWMRADRHLIPPGAFENARDAERYLTPRPVVVPESELRRPALVLRELATGDRWWQWGDRIAWVGDHEQSGRLMLDQAARGLPLMVARLEAPAPGQDPPWERAGWVADQLEAKWNPATGRAEWRSR